MEHPILFKGDMVRAILEDRKAQTRRVIRPQPKNVYYTPDRPDWGWHTHEKGGTILSCPYGQPGDVLWVKEGYQITSGHFESLMVEGFYLADEMPFLRGLTADEWDLWSHRKKPYAKTSGRFMYKSLARLRRAVKNVRVERVQDITDRDALAEGVDFVAGLDLPSDACYWTLFKTLWDSINYKRGFGWDVNPWLWVVEFEKET